MEEFKDLEALEMRNWWVLRRVLREKLEDIRPVDPVITTIVGNQWFHKHNQ